LKIESLKDESVFLVMELWVNPEFFIELKSFKKKMNAILEKYAPNYVHHSHAIEWISKNIGEDLPTGIEIIQFASKETAKQVVTELKAVEMKALSDKIFKRTRAYLSHYDFPESLLDRMGL